MAFALCSDAGTPGIDPGFLLVRACVDAGIDVNVCQEPRFVPALVTSGLPCDRFYFEGFLPHKKGRQKRLTALLEMPCTVSSTTPTAWPSCSTSSTISVQANARPQSRNLQASRRKLRGTCGVEGPSHQSSAARRIRGGPWGRRLNSVRKSRCTSLTRLTGTAVNPLGDLGGLPWPEISMRSMPSRDASAMRCSKRATGRIRSIPLPRKARAVVEGQVQARTQNGRHNRQVVGRI